MAKFLDVELAMIAVIPEEEEEAEQKVKKRKWVHEAWCDVFNYCTVH